MSFSTILSAVIEGLKVEFIQVEADVSNGLPIFHMVGYLSSEVKEAGERVRTAIKNSGFEYPAKRIVVNLSPATMRKRGASFDLPIAAAILVSLGQVKRVEQDCLIIGELSLDGGVKKVPGVLPIIMEAKDRGVRRCIVPAENVAEALLVSGIEIVGVATLKEAASVMCGQKSATDSSGCGKEREGRECKEENWEENKLRGTEKSSLQKNKICSRKTSENVNSKIADFADMKGQEFVKRAAEIAVAGGHNLLLVGPPGSGKSMTAKCIAGILPPLDLAESLEITKIYSVLGLLDEELPLIMERPFREVHHTTTKSALIGGGVIPRPGEISLAHGGVLFLDELPEFQRDTLEVLRQPLEECRVNISRTCGNYTFPSNFMLVAAMNPCPCGCFPDERKGESSKDIRKRICRIREIQKERYKGTGIATNAMLDGKSLNRYCRIGKEEKAIMEQAFSAMGLTARGYHRVLKTARTIADMEESDRITARHLKEALGYRINDRKYADK